MTAERRWGVTLALALAPLTTTGAAWAQEPPAYQALRFEEDWSAIREGSARPDLWDRLKFVPIGSSGTYVTLAGEARERYEVLDHPAFGAGPTDTNGYALQRYLFSADVHTAKRFRIFAEIQSGFSFGRAGGPRSTDVNRLDLHQAFVDVTPIRTTNHRLTARVGRQEFAIGSGRLISPGEGLNVRRSFDGVRTILQSGRWTWNAVAFQEVRGREGVFDDAPDDGVTFWGAGTIGPHPFWKGGHISAYYLGLNRERSGFVTRRGSSTRHTLGSRSWWTAGPFELSHETIGQWGTFQHRSIRAWALSADAAFVGADAASVRTGLRFDIASGDRGQPQGGLTAFDPLFPSAIAYSGSAGLVAPTNLVAVTPSLQLGLRRNVIATMDLAAYWRVRRNDEVYSVSGAALSRDGSTSRARYVGIDPSIGLRWQVDRHTAMSAFYSAFVTGPFLVQSTAGKRIHYAATSLTYRF